MDGEVPVILGEPLQWMPSLVKAPMDKKLS